MSGKFADFFLVVADTLVVFTSTLAGEGSWHSYYSLLRSQISLQQAGCSPRNSIHGAVHS